MSNELFNEHNSAESSHRMPRPGQPQTTNKPHFRLRKVWLNAHLYIGLFAGAVFVLIGLTGSILAFRQEIDTWLNAGILTVTQPADGKTAYRPLDEILSSAKAAMPAGGSARFCSLSEEPKRLCRSHLLKTNPAGSS